MKIGYEAAIAAAMVLIAGCGPTTEGGHANPPLQDDAEVVVEEAGVSMAAVDDIAAFLEANRDEILVINFWATWCPPCVHEMPELAAFYEAYRDRGVAFLSLSSDSIEDYETKLVPFVDEYDLPFHVYAIANLDPDALDEHLNVGMDFALPTTFVFDRDRNVVQKWMRNITQADLERAVEPLIAQGDGAPAQ